MWGERQVDLESENNKMEWPALCAEGEKDGRLRGGHRDRESVGPEGG